MSRFARFDRYIAKSDDGCWLWTGALNSHGYGMFSLGSRQEGNATAHRFSFERYVRPLLAGEMVLHSCHRPACVNPEHLRAGSHIDNMRDMVVAGRSLRGDRNAMRTAQGISAFKRATPRGSKHHAAVLDEEMVRNARLASKQGLSGRAIAKLYGCSQRTIARVLAGEAWTHV